MPCLQVDCAALPDTAGRERLARALVETYVRHMQCEPWRVVVVLRELGAFGVTSLRDGELAPQVFVQCDIRRGRPAAQREELAAALLAELASALDASPEAIIVHFTQHAGDEVYRSSGWSGEWSPIDTA